MCPVCIATAAIIAGSATGTGGLTALAVGRLRKKDDTGKFPKATQPEEDHLGHHDN